MTSAGLGPVSGPPALVMDSSYVEADTVNRLGHAAYSYAFAMRQYLPLLQRWSPVIEITQPESRLDFHVHKLRNEGKQPLHLSFRPLQDVYLSRHATNAAYVFWEFPDIPESAFGSNPRND